MKKAFIIFFSLFFLLAAPLSAAARPTLSLSDAIYADLALNHYLDNVSLDFTDGKAGDTVQVNETRHWIPASTVKLFAALYAYKLIKDGTLSLSDAITISDKNEVPTELVTDDLPTLYTGETVTLDRLIRQMLIQSDNTAFNQLLDVLGRDSITQYVQSLGLTHTHIGSKLNLDDSQTQYEYDVPGYGVNTTTAQDYTQAFSLIKNNKIPGAKELFNTLKEQRINNMIPYFLPKDVVCAHKTGDWAPLFHDGGICEDKKHAYILTVFTNADDPTYVAHLSEIVYSHNYNLVGQKPTKPAISQLPSHQLDALVMTTPSTKYVLGSSTTSFPTPAITAADLGIKASDLNVIIPDNKLPPVIIPADSPFHGLVDAWDVTRLLIAPNAKARLAVTIEVGERRIAEAKQLASNGKTQEAQAIFDTVQKGLQVVAKDSTVENNPVVQTQLQAISETRFNALQNSLQQVKGDQKVEIIQQIAQEAKQTVKEVEPHLPDATSATSPSQKVLTGTITNVTATTATIRTPGGQEIAIPTNASTITLKTNTEASPTPIETPTASPTGDLSETPSPTDTTPSPEQSTVGGLQVGTTVALLGSNKNNTFAPTVIVPNVPRELVAPQPVVVAKVTSDHLVVEENGVYTQVNVNPDTTIKAADTNIPLAQIHAGDVVVVHGEPLTPTNPSSTVPPTSQPETTPASTSPTSHPSNVPSSLQATQAPLITSAVKTNSTTPAILPTITGSIPTGKVINNPTITGKTSSPSIYPTGKIPQNTPAPTNTKTTTAPTTPPVTPQVINSTSIQVIEQKKNLSLPLPSQSPSTPTNPPAAPQSKPNSPQQNQPAPQAPANNPPAAPVQQKDTAPQPTTAKK